MAMADTANSMAGQARAEAFLHLRCRGKFHVHGEGSAAHRAKFSPSLYFS